MFTNIEDAKTYTLAGKATITLASKVTEKWFTYKVTRKVDRETGEPGDIWFVALLNGPDNMGDYAYIGMIDKNGFRTTKGSKAGNDAPSVRGFNYFWKHVMAGRMPKDMEIRHEMTCGRCGLALTVPESIDSGLGPECRKKIGL